MDNDQNSELLRWKKLAEDREKELLQLEDFLKTFRHEIRSPVQALCFAPERLGIILHDEYRISPRNLPKRLTEYLLDLKATGERVEIVSKALTLHPEELVKEIILNNLYKNCIAPVLAFTKSIAEKKGRRIFENKDSLLVDLPFDAEAMQIAFHALINNAIKYSDYESEIKVFGISSSDAYQIVVENISGHFPVAENEIPQICTKYFRGHAAKTQKVEGSGIGLYMASEIMRLHKGELVLLQANSPVRFALRLRNQ